MAHIKMPDEQPGFDEMFSDHKIYFKTSFRLPDWKFLTGKVRLLYLSKTTDWQLKTRVRIYS